MNVHKQKLFITLSFFAGLAFAPNTFAADYKLCKCEQQADAVIRQNGCLNNIESMLKTSGVVAADSTSSIEECELDYADIDTNGTYDATYQIKFNTSDCTQASAIKVTLQTNPQLPLACQPSSLVINR